MMPAHMGKGRSLLGVTDQMLISSGNTLTDTWKNNVLQALWTFLSTVKLTQN